MKALHALLLAALVPLTSRGALVVPSRIESTLAGMVQRGEVVGVSAVVFENGKEAYFGAFGMADREAGRPMARDTLAVIYSMTKPVTAVALLQLQEQGKLQMDDPIEKYLPEFGNLRVWAGGTAAEPQTVALDRPLTIRDLGRNTAGFAVGDGLPEGLATVPGGLGRRFLEHQFARPGAHRRQAAVGSPTRRTLALRHPDQHPGPHRREGLGPALRRLSGRAHLRRWA